MAPPVRPMPPVMKLCTGPCGESKPLDDFSPFTGSKDGRRSRCKECRAADQKKRDRAASQREDARAARVLEQAEERARRVASDHEPLRPGDLDEEYGTGISNDKSADGRARTAKASREKRQEYNKNMGAFREGVLGAASMGSPIPPELARYISELAEQERRFQNRRDARSLALFEANEVLQMRRFTMLAERYLAGRITPVAYARQKSSGRKKRTVILHLSDLHLGAELHSLDEPMAFRAVEEARRLEFVVRQAIDYKPQYRKDTRLILIINGDVIEGQLGHGPVASGAPLAEQKLIFWVLFEQVLGLLAAAFPEVHVVCQPGNHGRDKQRHPGRATARKWDGHEWELYQALRMMCARLANVTWDVGFRAIAKVDLYGKILGVTHGDTEVKIGDPDTQAKANASALDRINATRVYGCEFDAWAFGHYHKGRFQPGRPARVFNGALIPPNGYARGEGYIGELCGQFLWEAVPGYPVGDVRFIEVGPKQDNDETLGKLIRPFRVENLAA